MSSLRVDIFYKDIHLNNLCKLSYDVGNGGEIVKLRVTANLASVVRHSFRYIMRRFAAVKIQMQTAQYLYFELNTDVPYDMYAEKRTYVT